MVSLNITNEEQMKERIRFVWFRNKKIAQIYVELGKRNMLIVMCSNSNVTGQAVRKEQTRDSGSLAHLYH